MSSSSSSPRLFSPSEVKLRLQDLLDNNEKQLQQAELLGQKVLSQQVELEERVRYLEELCDREDEADELDANSLERYQALLVSVNSWTVEVSKLLSGFGTLNPVPLPSFISVPRQGAEQPQASASTAASNSRRAKNAAHRADDIEFTFEIGGGLLAEVRRLQNALAERDKTILDMKEERAGLELSLEILRNVSHSQTQDMIPEGEPKDTEVKNTAPISTVPLAPKPRSTASSVLSLETPPPVPSSPPPPELVRRATTPTPRSTNSASGRKGSSSMPPSHQSRRHPSNNSIQSSASDATNKQNHSFSPGATSTSGVGGQNDRRSAASLTSNGRVPFPRLSQDHILPMNPSSTLSNPLYNPNKAGGLTAHNATDHRTVHAITKIMIGDFMYKYTRRAVGTRFSEYRHKRFFWVHPYTKTVYWSLTDPGSPDVAQLNAKGVFMKGVRAVIDPNPLPPALCQYSIVVSTPERELKLTAPTKTKHDIWLNALKFLLSRPAPDILPPEDIVHSRGFTFAAEESTDQQHSPQRRGRGRRKGSEVNARNDASRTRRSRSHSRSSSVGGPINKRLGTPASEYLRWTRTPSPDEGSELW